MPDIEDDIRAADAANTAWKAAMSRTAAPRELTATEFWGEFVACDWPGVWRAVVTERAAELCHRMGVLRSSRTVRPGIPALLRQADALGVPVAIVSNALSGRVHREFVAEHGLARGISAQIYSDEVGLRKPNPALIRLAAAALGVDVGSAWFVGDTPDRDIRCARRAGVGAAILMASDSIGVAGERVSCRADVTVADPAALISLLGAACRRDQVSR
jgi:HAD superfamily hydrolase (TIGR01549 family)